MREVTEAEILRESCRRITSKNPDGNPELALSTILNMQEFMVEIALICIALKAIAQIIGAIRDIVDMLLTRLKSRKR